MNLPDSQQFIDDELQRRVLAALERPHRLGMIGGDLADHVAHASRYSALFENALGPNAANETTVRAADLGTGGGIPGVVLAALCPQWRWTLIDVRLARAQEVAAAVARLDLESSCEVLADAAQELGRQAPLRESFDLIVARSFGPSPLLAECAAGLLRVGGALIVSEPPASDISERWPAAALALFGFGAAQTKSVAGSPFVMLRKAEPTPARFPRTPPRSGRGWPTSA